MIAMKTTTIESLNSDIDIDTVIATATGTDHHKSILRTYHALASIKHHNRLIFEGLNQKDGKHYVVPSTMYSFHSSLRHCHLPKE